MAVHPPKRRFTAEIKKCQQTPAFGYELRSEECSWSTPPVFGKQIAGSMQDRDQTTIVGEPLISALPPASPNPIELATLHEELRQLKDAIEKMKLQIAALRHESSPPAPWEKATGELDAVVRATELATQDILEAAEAIDALLHEVRISGEAGDLLDRAAERIVRIFEACNFQDITGQRINKVVSAMKFIETKIERMIDILGGQDALRNVEPFVEEQADEDASLLEGPQLNPETTISQNDIDRFFD